MQHLGPVVHQPHDSSSATPRVIPGQARPKWAASDMWVSQHVARKAPEAA